MMTEIGLTNEDKIGVITSHIKNALFNKYNAELTIIQENAVASPSAVNIQRANESIAAADAQIVALEAQRAALTE
jgi:hypothetical protein